MAPPPHRRPGFSRRAQLGIFAAYVFAVAGVLAALLLLLASWLDPRGFDALRIAASEAVAPVTRPVNQLRRNLREALADGSAYWEAGRQNRALRRALAESRIRAAKVEALELENRRLRGLLGLARTVAQPVATGHLMASSPGSSRRIATLSIGALAGVRSGMPVRAPEGLIGRVTAVGPSVSHVLLLTDTDNLVPVIRASDGLPAFASGHGDGRISIKPVNIGENSLKQGDLFISSGSGGLYNPGIPVARVLARTADGAIALAAAEPARVSHVLVERAFRPGGARIRRAPGAAGDVPPGPVPGDAGSSPGDSATARP